MMTAGIGLLLCLVAALGVLYFMQMNRISQDSSRLYLVSGSMAAHSLHTKDAVMLAYDRLLDYFSYNRDQDWDIFEQALQTARDESDRMLALLGYVSGVGEDRTSELVLSISQNLGLFTTLSLEGKTLASLTATARERFCTFIMRAEGHSRYSLDALLDPGRDDGSPESREFVIRHFAELLAISQNISKLQSDTLKAIIYQDISYMDRNDATFTDTRIRIEGLFTQAGAQYSDTTENLKLELEQYVELTDRFHRDWANLIAHTRICDTVGKTIIAEATTLIEAVNFMNDAALRQQRANHARMQALYALLLGLTLLGGLIVLRKLLRRLVEPLEDLGRFAREAAGGPWPNEQAAAVGVDPARIAHALMDGHAEARRQQQAARLQADAMHHRYMQARKAAAHKEVLLEQVQGLVPLLRKLLHAWKDEVHAGPSSGAAQAILDVGQALDALENQLSWTAEDCSAGPFDPQALISGLHKAFTAQAEDKGLAFTLSLPADLPAWLHGDTDSLSLLLHCLLDNALHFTDEGSVEVRVEHLARPTTSQPEAETPTSTLAVSVSDSGGGMRDEHIARLVGGGPARVAPRKGDQQREASRDQGQGLHVCNRLLQKLGATVDVRSAPGSGTVIRVTVPVGQAATPSPASPEARHPVPDAPGRVFSFSQAPAEPTGRRALVLAPDLSLRSDLRDLLTKAGLDVTTAQEIAAVPDLLRTGSFDILFMQLPFDSAPAIEAVRQILQLVPEEQAMPLVGIVGAPRLPPEQYLQAGVQALLETPLDAQAVQAALDRYFGNASPMIAEETMPGLDIALGLHHLNGNEQLYNKLLRRFADSNAQVGQELQTAVDAGDMETAIRVAHTLKVWRPAWERRACPTRPCRWRAP